MLILNLVLLRLPVVVDQVNEGFGELGFGLLGTSVALPHNLLVLALKGDVVLVLWKSIATIKINDEQALGDLSLEKS